MAKGKSKRRQTENEKKRYKRTKQYLEGGGESRYARKRAYLNKVGLWGFEVADPKPWK